MRSAAGSVFAEVGTLEFGGDRVEGVGAVGFGDAVPKSMICGGMEGSGSTVNGDRRPRVTVNAIWMRLSMSERCETRMPPTLSLPKVISGSR